jgi:hypothetical protein
LFYLNKSESNYTGEARRSQSFLPHPHPQSDINERGDNATSPFSDSKIIQLLEILNRKKAQYDVI